MVQRVSTNNFATAKWIVDANGVNAGATHSTIASALSDAVSGETIAIKPGTYTENLTLKAGVNLLGMGGDSFSPNLNSSNVSIVGKCLFTGTGKVSLVNLFLETNADYALEVSGTGDSDVSLENCFINCTDNTGVLSSSSGTSRIQFYNCMGTITTNGNAIFSKSDGLIIMTNCKFGNVGTNTTANTNSDASLFIFNCEFSNPFTISGTGSLTMDFTSINLVTQAVTAVTTTSSNAISIQNSSFKTGSATAITLNGSGDNKVENCILESSNANTIDGSGSIQYGSLQGFGTATNMTISTSTQVTNKMGPRILLSGGAEILAGSGDPSGSVTAPQGSLFLRTDGSSTSTRAYINTNGTTGWTSITTAS